MGKGFGVAEEDGGCGRVHCEVWIVWVDNFVGLMSGVEAEGMTRMLALSGCIAGGGDGGDCRWLQIGSMGVDKMMMDEV